MKETKQTNKKTLGFRLVRELGGEGREGEGF